MGVEALEFWKARLPVRIRLGYIVGHWFFCIMEVHRLLGCSSYPLIVSFGVGEACSRFSLATSVCTSCY